MNHPFKVSDKVVCVRAVKRKHFIGKLFVVSEAYFNQFGSACVGLVATKSNKVGGNGNWLCFDSSGNPHFRKLDDLKAENSKVRLNEAVK